MDHLYYEGKECLIEPCPCKGFEQNKKIDPYTKKSKTSWKKIPSRYPTPPKVQ